MDDKLASLITYVQTHQQVVSVELQASERFRLVVYLSENCQTQGTPLDICNGMPKSLSAITKSLRVSPGVWHFQFLELTGTGLDDFDGRMLAAALEKSPRRVSLKVKRLDLTQIEFLPVIQARLLGILAAPLRERRLARRVRVVEQGRRPCGTCPEGPAC